MKATPEHQAQLLELQTVDTAIDQLNHKRQTLPEHEEIAKIKAFRAQLRERLVAQNTTVSDLESEMAKAEADLKPVKERRERNQARIDAGEVPDAKTLTSMIEEVAHLGRRIGELEDEQLELMERLEAETQRQAAYQAKDAEIGAKLEEATGRRDAQLAELDADLAKLQHDRDAQAAAVPDDLLALYDKIRARMGGVGVGKLAGGRCGGCQLEINPADMNRYNATPADEVLRCEECDRILVR